MTKVLTLALAAVLAMGTLDAAAARQKKLHASPQPTASEMAPSPPGVLVPVENGTPVIMQGYHSPGMIRETAAAKEPISAPTARSRSRAAAAPIFRRPIRRLIPATARRPRR